MLIKVELDCYYQSKIRYGPSAPDFTESAKTVLAVGLFLDDHQRLIVENIQLSGMLIPKPTSICIVWRYHVKFSKLGVLSSPFTVPDAVFNRALFLTTTSIMLHTKSTRKHRRILTKC